MLLCMNNFYFKLKLFKRGCVANFKWREDLGMFHHFMYPLSKGADKRSEDHSDQEEHSDHDVSRTTQLI